MFSYTKLRFWSNPVSSLPHFPVHWAHSLGLPHPSIALLHFWKLEEARKHGLLAPNIVSLIKKKKKYSQRLLDIREKHTKSVCKLKRNQATKCCAEDNPIIFHFKYSLWLYLCPRAAQLVKNLPAMKEALVWFLGQEVPLEKGQATHSSILGLPWWLSGKEPACNVGDLGSIPGFGKITWNINPLQYSCLENTHGQRSLAGSSPWSRRVRRNWATKRRRLEEYTPKHA